MNYPNEPKANSPAGHPDDPSDLGIAGIRFPFLNDSDSGIKFLVKFNEVSKNLETPVENALNTAEKIRSRFPGAEIDVEMDVKIL